MGKHIRLFIAVAAVAAVVSTAGCRRALWRAEDRMVMARAEALAREVLIVDTHIDMPFRLKDKMDDAAHRTSGDFDYPRAVKGGLDAFFIVVYVPPEMEDAGTAGAFTEKTIDDVHGLVKRHPDKFAIARTPEEVREQFGSGRVSFVLAIENGAPIEGDLGKVRHFFERGVRYITLSHGKSNHICDSSYDKERKWRGLSPFGRELVAEMNRVGMMIDVSHVSDEAFWQVIELSKTPVIASHSSCRHFTPGMERNMDDEMIKALAANGGVIQISFGEMFIKDEVARKSRERWGAIERLTAEHKLEGEARRMWVQQYKRANPVGRATVADVADHIDHVVNLVGVDHVGFGSDFDGVDDQVPVGLEDVSKYPNLIYELLKRGYSEQDIRKISGENLLRVWGEVLGAAERIP